MKKNNEEVLTIDLDWIQGPRQEIDIIALCVKLFLLKIDNDSLGYDLDSKDEVIAWGKFNS